MRPNISDPWLVREQGKAACRSGLSRSANPYSYLSAHWFLWVEGFVWYEVYYRGGGLNEKQGEV